MLFLTDKERGKWNAKIWDVQKKWFHKQSTLSWTGSNEIPWLVLQLEDTNLRVYRTDPDEVRSYDDDDETRQFGFLCTCRSSTASAFERSDLLWAQEIAEIFNPCMRNISKGQHSKFAIDGASQSQLCWTYHCLQQPQKHESDLTCCCCDKFMLIKISCYYLTFHGFVTAAPPFWWDTINVLAPATVFVHICALKNGDSHSSNSA